MLSRKRVARVRKEIPRSRILKEIQVTARVAVTKARYSASILERERKLHNHHEETSKRTTSPIRILKCIKIKCVVM